MGLDEERAKHIRPELIRLLSQQSYVAPDDVEAFADLVVVMLRNDKQGSDMEDDLVDLIGDEVRDGLVAKIFALVDHQEAPAAGPESDSKPSTVPQVGGTTVEGAPSNEEAQESSRSQDPTAPDQAETGQGPEGFPATEEDKRPSHAGPLRTRDTRPRPRHQPLGKRAHDEVIPLCKFADTCTAAHCTFAHPTPAAKAGDGLVLTSAACAFGAECTNAECTRGHPSPALAKHRIPVPCRYNPCLNPLCRFSHVRPPRATVKGSETTDERKFAEDAATEKLQTQST